ncbi:cytochrome c oxidase subunit II [Alkalihalobacillus macyae]|uniref:cytochrome c oxidase subunit II n=1 Tax=Guptibacillus hwajinpoensis TaxID=208199 RepID=UPI00273B85ED|nr:cytochrome c oxidase subunit II [Alkalihalobacillus macyae]MDP4553139.1 cytochrome c oxidase subunit II [Alkalihalobacillus macyae]
MKRWRNAWRFLPLLSVIALTLTGCGNEQLTTLLPKGEGSEMQFNLMMLSLYIMIGVFVVVALIYTIVLVRFRRRGESDNEIPEQTEGNVVLEILWTVVPIILLLILAVPTVMATFALDEGTEKVPEGATVVKVTAHQYWWEFEYPDLGVKTAQDLYIPSGERVYFELASKDVLHSFWVPTLGGKMDTNTATVNKMWLNAQEPGTYYGKCAELCGPAHALMDFKVIAQEKEDFEAWAESMKEASSQASTDQAAQGEEIFANSCIGCHAVGADGGNTGPNLTNFGDREKVAGILDHTDENIKAWIAKPSEFKPGNNMPAFEDQLNDEELNALVVYLNGLKVEE